MLLEQLAEGDAEPDDSPRGKAIVIGNGRCPDAERLPRGTLDGARLVVAADGGLRTALALGLRPDFVVGDGDSLREADAAAMRERRIPLHAVPAAKDESDLQIALRSAAAARVAEIVVIGALDGDRVEHALANVLLLAWPALAGLEVSLVDDRSTIRAIRAADSPVALSIAGRPGDFVSLLPVAGDAAAVTTDGLRYPLAAEPLLFGASRGLSNELSGTQATVTVRAGVVLVVHTRDAEREPTEREDDPDGTS